MESAFYKLQHQNLKWKDKSRSEKFIFFLKIYLVLFTSSGFMMFICEEAMQMASFGAFAYNSAKDGYGMQQHIKMYMKPTAAFSELMIYGLGWLNPIMYPAYISYCKVNQGYIKAAEKEASALIAKGY